MKSFVPPNLIFCSHSCVVNAWYASTNFKESLNQAGKETSELNKHKSALTSTEIRLFINRAVLFQSLYQSVYTTYEIDLLQ